MTERGRSDIDLKPNCIGFHLSQSYLSYQLQFMHAYEKISQSLEVETEKQTEGNATISLSLH